MRVDHLFLDGISGVRRKKPSGSWMGTSGMNTTGRGGGWEEEEEEEEGGRRRRRRVGGGGGGGWEEEEEEEGGEEEGELYSRAMIELCAFIH